jgi:hypothetical protein
MSPAAIPLTDSLKVSVNTGTSALVGVAGGVHAAVGGVPSKVTVFAADAVPGAVLPAGSLTAPEARVSTTVPSVGVGLSRLTVYVAPDPVIDATVHPLEVPVIEKSFAARPDTDSLKVRV